MRIAPTLESDQIDRIFTCIEDNEVAIVEGGDQPIYTSFLTDAPSVASQVTAIALIRRLAENGLLYAHLMGRELLLLADAKDGGKASGAKTIGELLTLAMSDLQLAVVHGDKDAHARRKGRAAPMEVLQALVG